MINILNNHLKSEIRKHAKAEKPNECCGIIVSNDDGLHVIKCKNVAKHKNKRFEIAPEDYLKAIKTGRVEAYYHSHTNGNTNLSMSDKLVSLAHKQTLIMYCLANDEFTSLIVEDTDNEKQ